MKANATCIVGTLYARDDPRRDAGFSIYYLGINLGAFVGPILTGLLQTSLGFHWGFALAAVGMAFGLVVYTLGRKNLPAEANDVPEPAARRAPALMIMIAAGVVVLIVVLALTRRPQRRPAGHQRRGDHHPGQRRLLRRHPGQQADHRPSSVAG